MIRTTRHTSYYCITTHKKCTMYVQQCKRNLTSLVLTDKLRSFSSVCRRQNYKTAENSFAIFIPVTFPVFLSTIRTIRSTKKVRTYFQFSCSFTKYFKNKFSVQKSTIKISEKYHRYVYLIFCTAQSSH